MSKAWIAASLLVGALGLATLSPPSAQAQTTRTSGLLLPVGGGYADVYPGIVAALLERAQAGRIEITVLPASYSSNAEAITAGERQVNLNDAERRRFEIEQACRRAAPAGVTCHAQIAPIFTRSDAEDPANLAFFDQDVTGVFLLGGDQSVAMRVLVNTPIEAALTRLYQRGGVIAGTSAGGAMQSQTMIAGFAPNFAQGNSLNRGAADLWRSNDLRGLPFGVERAILDQHFFQRSRLGRLLEAISRAEAPHIGVGIDAYTGLRVANRTQLHKVFGLYTVAVLDAESFAAAKRVQTVGAAETISLRNVLVHLLAPGDFSYDLTTRRHSLAAPPVGLTRQFTALTIPPGAGALLLGGNLKADSPLFAHFAKLAGATSAPLWVVAAGYPNDRPAQRAADILAKSLGNGAQSVVVSAKNEAPLTLPASVGGIVVLGRDQSLLDPARLIAIKAAWLAGAPLLLDNAAAALAGSFFSAHEPTPEEGDEAEIAVQRSFLQERTVITDGLGLVDAMLEPQIIENNRWGRLFALAYTHPQRLALGLSDDAALLITAKEARVLGEGVLFVLDLSQATLALGDNKQFVIANGLLDLFAPGEAVQARSAELSNGKR
jgi:cyanophycinase